MDIRLFSNFGDCVVRFSTAESAYNHLKWKSFGPTTVSSVTIYFQLQGDAEKFCFFHNLELLLSQNKCLHSPWLDTFWGVLNIPDSSSVLMKDFFLDIKLLPYVKMTYDLSELLTKLSNCNISPSKRDFKLILL